jgi:hypothetical protein
MRNLVMVAAILVGCGGQPLDAQGGGESDSGGAGGAGGSGGSPSMMPPTGGADAGTGGAGAGEAPTQPPPNADAATTLPAGPTFPCGPDGAGLVCSCGLQPYFPPPAGSGPVDPSSAVGSSPGYTTAAEFDALIVGRWVRTAGMAELSCEQYGLDFTADHRIVPLVIASDGSIQAVPAKAQSYTLDLARWPTPALVVDGGDLITNAPVFPGGPDAMYFVFDPWYAQYARVP